MAYTSPRGEPLRRSQGLAELCLRYTSGPQAKTDRKFLGDHLAIVLLLCEDDLVGENFLNTRVGEDVNLITGKAFLGVFRNSLIKAREVSCQILVKEIKQLSSELNTCRATTADTERKKASTFLVRTGRQVGQFEVLNDLVSDHARIVNILEEECIL
ncbi:hypothetical protein HG530_006010 [Fusarium avenaceum]|nr:hypothetical protein HG530_006010 [Fusarium avenaceum]